MCGVRTTFLRLLALGVFLAAALLCAPRAMADGKMFAVEVADVSGAQIPDQAALICWDPKTKTQTLAIDTRFIGKGTEFGWVVPLPSRPEVKPGTKGMFPSLRGMFAPVVQTRGAGGAPVLLVMVVIILLVLYAKRWMGLAVALTMGVVLVAIMLPALGSAGAGMSGTVAEPEFVERRIVGDFEVTTLESPEGAVVVDWLRSHNFHVPAAAEKVIDQYAKEKWSFVATRLVRESDMAEASTAHPLVFTFKTDAPVYPMRLTGADAKRDLSVELFVFGPSRAAANGFDVAGAGPAQVGGPGVSIYRSRPSSRAIKVVHSAISSLVASAAFGTRLTATLKPAEMGRDVQIGWTDGGETGRSAQSWHTAGGFGLDVGLGVMFIGLCLVEHFEKTRSLPRRTALKWSLLAGISTGLLTFAAIPKVSSLSMRDSWRTRRDLQGDMLEASIRWSSIPKSLSLVEASAILDQCLTNGVGDERKRLTRGDAPGQVDIRVMDGTIRLVVVSAAGAEQWEYLWPTDDPDTQPRFDPEAE